MTLPVLDKNWQMQVNQTVAAQGSVLATMRRLFRTLKNLFKSFPLFAWTVTGSSNGAAAGLDAVDRWAADTDLVWAASGSAHSWIVLRQTGIAANFEICIDLNNATGGNGSIVFSPSAGFTGGTTTNRPTAVDEAVVINNSLLAASQDVQFQIQGLESSDGQCTRFSIWRGGTNNCTFCLFDKPKNPVTGWANPSVVFWLASAAGIAASYANLGNNSALGRARGVSTMNIGLTGEGTDATAATGFIAQDATLGTVPNSFSGEWFLPPIGISSKTALNIGRHGQLFDLWWKPSGVTDGLTFPNNAATRQFAALGNLVFPWTGDATDPLLA